MSADFILRDSSLVYSESSLKSSALFTIQGDAHGQITVRSWSDQVRSQSDHCHITVRSRSDHGQITVRSRSYQGQITVRSRSDHGRITVGSRSDHGQITVQGNILFLYLNTFTPTNVYASGVVKILLGLLPK